MPNGSPGRVETAVAAMRARSSATDGRDGDGASMGFYDSYVHSMFSLTRYVRQGSRFVTPRPDGPRSISTALRPSRLRRLVPCGRRSLAGAWLRRADKERGSAERTLRHLAKQTGFARHRDRVSTLALPGGCGGGWPPDSRARRRTGRSPQGCVAGGRRAGATRMTDAGDAGGIRSPRRGKGRAAPSPQQRQSAGPWLPRVPLGAPAPPRRILAAPLAPGCSPRRQG